MSKYQWNSTVLQKKARKFNRLVSGFGGVGLVCYFILPESLKMISTIVIIIAILMLALSWNVQGKDKKLKTNRG